MQTAESVVRRATPAGRLSGRMAMPVAKIAAAVAAVFLLTAGGLLWASSHSRGRLRRDLEIDKVRAIGQSLASAAEVLVAAGDVRGLKRVISQAESWNSLDSCLIRLPNGPTIAGFGAEVSSLGQMPERWTSPAGAHTETVDGDSITMTWPVKIAGRGSLILKIKASQTGWLAESTAARSELVIIGVAGLISLLVIYRYALAKFRAIAGIRQALLEMRDGTQNISDCEVSPRLGPEAEAWNKLLRERAQLQKQRVLGQARQSLHATRAAGASVLGAACDGLPYGLILVDADKRVKYANGAAAVLLQTTPDKLMGTDIAQFVGDPRVIEPLEVMTRHPIRRHTVVEVRHGKATSDGILRYVIRPVRRDDSGIAMVIIEDITQQRVAEEARNTFLAQATHELRTPLTNIRLYAETALVEGEKDPAIKAKCMNVINQESRRLERMVSDILSVSEIEAGSFKIDRDDVRFDVLLEQLKADYTPQAHSKEIDLVFKLPAKLPVIQADRDKISLALHNLIGNALKYTPRGGQVTVNATIDREQLAIDVTDTGIGIDAGDIDKIFEKFYRAKDNRVMEIPGSGMGLSLAREVVRLHGGDIAVKSEPNKGSDFTLILPISGEAA